MSNISNGSVTSKSSNKSKFSVQLKELLVVAKHVLGHVNDIDSLDQLLDEKRDLERKLESKTEEVLAKDREIASLKSAREKETAKLQSANDSLIDEFSKRYKAWDTGSTRQKDLQNEVIQLKSQLSQATRRADSSEDELSISQQRLSECQHSLAYTESELKTVRKELGSKDMELKGTVAELELVQTTLEAERQALGLMDLDHDNLAIKFSALTDKFHKLAKIFFFTKLPEDVTHDSLSAKLYSSGFTKVAPKCIPFSNSVQSQYLRMAAAEKVIACKLCSNIFQQYYLPESSFARQAIDDVLKRLSDTSPCEEAIFRLRLLSAYEQEEQQHVTSVMASTTSEVVGILGPLLAPNSRDGFQDEFNKLLQEAVKLWRPVQRSAVSAVVDNDPEPDWGKHKDYDTTMGSNADQVVQVPSNPIEPLFPRVSIGDDILCQGYALWSGQNTVVAAAIEHSQLKSPSSTHTRTGSVRGGLTRQGNDRRLSSSGSVGSRPGDTPASPRNQSFQDHLNSRNMASP